MSHCREKSVRDEVIGKKWIYLETHFTDRVWAVSEGECSLGRNTLHRVWAVAEGESSLEMWCGSHFLKPFILNRKIIALEYWFDFCQISVWISYRSPPSWISLLPPIISHPSRLLQSPSLSSMSHTANSHWLSIRHMAVDMFPCYSLHSSYPLLPSPLPVSISLFSMSNHAYF